MRKSTIIATCLVNSNMMDRLENAEHSVKQIFLEEFPKSSFSEWNQDLNDKAAEDIIRTVGKASRINIKKFIEDLW